MKELLLRFKEWKFDRKYRNKEAILFEFAVQNDGNIWYSGDVTEEEIELLNASIRKGTSIHEANRALINYRRALIRS